MKAFPSNGFYEKTGGGEQPQKLNPVMGMDLRDYFAAKALSVLYKQFSEFEEGFVCSEVANAAYKMADAMMIERQKSS
jgi:hypothetical protein